MGVPSLNDLAVDGTLNTINLNGYIYPNDHNKVTNLQYYKIKIPTTQHMFINAKKIFFQPRTLKSLNNKNMDISH